jgi:hypothetical protein
VLTGFPNAKIGATFCGLYPPEWDDLDFDEMEFFREAQEKAKLLGLAIIFAGSHRASCDLIILREVTYVPAGAPAPGPFSNMVHAVEFTGDYVTDLTYLWKSFSHMGNLESRFAIVNTPTRWDCENIGEA